MKNISIRYHHAVGYQVNIDWQEDGLYHGIYTFTPEVAELLRIVSVFNQYQEA